MLIAHGSTCSEEGVGSGRCRWPLQSPLQSCSPAAALICALGVVIHQPSFSEGLKIIFFLFQKMKKTSGNLRIGLCERERSSSLAHCSIAVICLDTINLSFEGSRWGRQQQLKTSFFESVGFPGPSSDQEMRLKSVAEKLLCLFEYSRAWRLRPPH